LTELQAAIADDGASGAISVDTGKTQGWLLKTAAKVGKGGLKIGTKIFTEIAIAAIEHYAGIEK
jgi:hypothetical protein